MVDNNIVPLTRSQQESLSDVLDHLSTEIAALRAENKRLRSAFEFIATTCRTGWKPKTICDFAAKFATNPKGE